jgi:hypothetical protein
MTLKYMGVTPMGQSPFAEDVAFVEAAWVSVYDQLQDPDLVPFPPDDIPDYACWPIMKYLAVEVGPRYGKVYPEDVKNIALSELNRSRFGGATGALPAKAKDY